MELTSAGINQQPAPFFSKRKAAVSMGVMAVATLLIGALSQWLPFTPVPAPTATEPIFEFTTAAYFWSFIISVQVIVASVLYQPRLHQPHH